MLEEEDIVVGIISRAIKRQERKEKKEKGNGKRETGNARRKTQNGRRGKGDGGGRRKREKEVA